MSLSSLPTELMLWIGRFLETPSLNSLIQTNKFFAHTLTHLLYDKELKLRRFTCDLLIPYNTQRTFAGCIRYWHSDIILSYFRTKPLEALMLVDGRYNPFFHYVVGGGNIQLAAVLLEKGVDVDLKDNIGRTLLLQPSTYALPDSVVTFLVDAGANLKAHTSVSKLAIVKAVKHVSFPVLEHMLKKLKMTQQTAGASDASPIQHILDQMLCRAVCSGNKMKICLLIRHGANPSAVCDGTTPLMLAIARSSTPTIINLLLDLGADISLPGTDGATVLSAWDIITCDDSVVKRILEIALDSGSNLSAPRSYIRTRIREAPTYTPSSMRPDDGPPYLKFMCKAQATPLHRFILTGNPDVVKLLVENGADLLAPSAVGYNPLQLSLATISPSCGEECLRNQIFRYLVTSAAARPDFDANRFFQFPVGMTFLHYLHVYRSPELARFVIDSSRGPDGKIGMDLLEDSEEFGTAIYLAMEYRFEDMAEVFFHAMKEQGCDFSGEIRIPGSSSGRDAGEVVPYLEYAVRSKLRRMEQLFREEIESQERGGRGV